MRHNLEVHQSLRDIDLVIRLQHDVVLRMPLLDDSFQIYHHVMTILARDLNLSLVSKVTETTGSNDGLTHGVGLVAWNFLWTLPLNRTIDIDLTAGLFAHLVHGQDNCRVIII